MLIITQIIYFFNCGLLVCYNFLSENKTQNLLVTFIKMTVRLFRMCSFEMLSHSSDFSIVRSFCICLVPPPPCWGEGVMSEEWGEVRALATAQR